MGDFLERRALICRENVIRTYLGMAKGLGGCRLVQGQAFKILESPMDLVLGNFVIEFDSDLEIHRVVEFLHEVRENMRTKPSFRVFLCDGDRPEGLATGLLSAGMTLAYRVEQFFGDFPGEECSRACLVEPQRRPEVGEFMVETIHRMRPGDTREAIIRSIVHSPHEIWAYEANGCLLGAALLSESEHAVGLYNLCVLPEARQNGIGTEMVNHCLQAAYTRKKPLVLQANAQNGRWYERMGLKNSGKLEAYR